MAGAGRHRVTSCETTLGRWWQGHQGFKFGISHVENSRLSFQAKLIMRLLSSVRHKSCMQSHIALFNMGMAPSSSTAPALSFLILPLASLFHSVEWHRWNKHSLFLGDSFFNFNYVYLCGYVCAHECKCHSGHKGELDPVKLKLQVVVSYMLMNCRNQSQIL